MNKQQEIQVFETENEILRQTIRAMDNIIKIIDDE